MTSGSASRHTCVWKLTILSPSFTPFARSKVLKQSMYVLVREGYSLDTTLIGYEVVKVSHDPTELVKEAHRKLDFYFKGYEVKEGTQLHRTVFWCDVPGRDIKTMYAIHKVPDE